jgi:hypothetical protein
LHPLRFGGLGSVLWEHFKAIEKRPLTGKNLFARAGNREQRRAIDLGNIHGAATSRRPFNGDVVAVHATPIKIAFQRIGLNCFSGTLAHLAKRPEWANGFYAELFFEFAPGRGFGVFSIVQLPLWDRLGAKIAVTPKDSARMDQQNINAGVATPVYQDAGAHVSHAVRPGCRNDGIDLAQVGCNKEALGNLTAEMIRLGSYQPFQSKHLFRGNQFVGAPASNHLGLFMGKRTLEEYWSRIVRWIKEAPR